MKAIPFARILRACRRCASLAAVVALAGGAPGVLAQNAPATTDAPVQTAPASGAAATATEAPLNFVRLTATFGGNTPIRDGISWRVFSEQAAPDGSRKVVATSSEPVARFNLADGDYIVHAAYGLAGVTKKISVRGGGVADSLAFTAGALRIVGLIGDQTIPPARESIAIYVPQPGNSEAKLVVANAKPGDLIGLPEGSYHLVSTYLDTVGVGSLNTNAANGGVPTNSIVNADIRVPGGKLVEATLRHRAATLTLKLVNNAGGEALANTSFTVLTPGGDVIRELIGAFPSLVLAEGEYVLIARRDGKTYQSTFTVQSTADRDIEVLVQ